MATTALPEEQLLELLIQLQKTTPEQARSILSAQPQIAYALMTLMIKLNVVNLEVLQTTLASAAQPPPAPPPMPVPQMASAVPPHLMQPQYRTGTPQNAPITAAPAHPSMYQAYGNGVQTSPNPTSTVSPPGYGVPPAPAAPSFPDILNHIPEDQKAMIMRVISMTPDQINRLPPTERASVRQMRTTLGLPVD
ncbi:hypothetical protein BD410DRAFT_821672 [Rickenella mellea]|uniref:Cleavage stimulation factor subunit 2 hinge domain-containing protein n=1 Tax=Rickenella mellea TaxID=50990 RepID=A0A4Y7Q290_9AGAM|nr:hypothetical protein BD410DRAFT_821672 [Rickenella mellea]